MGQTTENPEMMALRPADQLLLYCARPRVDAVASEQIRSLAHRNLDWVSLLRSAQRHGLLALLHHRLAFTAADTVPPDLMHSLREFSIRSRERNQYLIDELFRVLNILDENGVPAVPFRGPAEASYLYEDLGLRYFNDVSLLVHKQHMRKAADQLLQAGYRPVFTLTRGQEAAQIQYHCEYRLYRRHDRVRVRLHWQLEPGNYSRPLDFARLQGDFRQVQIGDQTVPTLAAHHLMLHLGVRMAQEFPLRLALVCDLARLIDRCPDLDWSRVIEGARQLIAERRLRVALRLVQDLLCTPAPRALSAGLMDDPAAETLATQIRENLFGSGDAERGMMAGLRFQAMARERMGDRFSYWLRMALTPSEGDWAFLPLPSRLSFLYRLLRPVRLGGQYLGLFAPKSLAEFGATPMEVAERMLALAEVRASDVVYDLGCGDGRLVITAAKRFGARGVGIDIDPARIAEANTSAREEGVDNLVSFRQQNVMEVDLTRASTIMLYMGAATNLLLRTRLQKELHRSTRIVSHDYDMGDWAPLKTELVPHADGVAQLYLWRVETGQAAARCA